MSNKLDFLYPEEEPDEESRLPYPAISPTNGRASAVAAAPSQNGMSPCTQENTPAAGLSPVAEPAPSVGADGVIHHPQLGELKLSTKYFIQGQGPLPGSVAARKGDFKLPRVPPLPPSNGKERGDCPSVAAHIAIWAQPSNGKERGDCPSYGPPVDSVAMAHIAKLGAELEKAAASRNTDKGQCSTAELPKIAQPSVGDKPPSAEVEPESPGIRTPPIDSSKVAINKLMELSRRADQGDEDAPRQIFEMLDRCPALWQEFGDLAAAAEGAMIRAVYGRNKAMTAMLMRHRDNLKAQLLGDRPTLLVKMTVQRVIGAWWFAQYVDIRFAETSERGGRMGEWGRMKVQAEKQFQIALRSLELVRKCDVLANQKLPAASNHNESERAEKPRAKPKKRRQKAGSKQAAVKQPEQDARCVEDISFNSSAEPFRQGESSTVNGADRLAPYLDSPRPKRSRSNRPVPRPAGATT